MLKNIDFVRQSIDLLEKLGLPYNICAKLFDLHYKYINVKLSSLFNKANEASLIYLYNKGNKLKHFNSKNIWIFWWQGRNDMPLIVRKCINSIVKHSKKHHVVLLSKNNIAKYVKLPSYVYNKLYKGEISFTLFSDILRFNLLKNYGGLWVDSTIYCISDLPSNCFSSLYTTSGGYTKYHSNVSLGKWTSFLFGGCSNQPLFIFMNEVLLLYWKYNDNIIDYFLTDFALKYAYINNIGGFKQYDDQIRPMPNMFKLSKFLNKRFDPVLYSKLCQNTYLFKLTYKKKFKKNENTFYYKLISQ